MSGLDLHIARDFKAPPHLIWRAWMDHKPYDPELHLGALKVASDAGG